MHMVHGEEHSLPKAMMWWYQLTGCMRMTATFSKCCPFIQVQKSIPPAIKQNGFRGVFRFLSQISIILWAMSSPGPASAIKTSSRSQSPSLSGLLAMHHILYTESSLTLKATSKCFGPNRKWAKSQGGGIWVNKIKRCRSEGRRRREEYARTSTRGEGRDRWNDEC